MIKETSMLTIMGLFLKEARLEKKETQSSISKHVGMTNAGWGRLENGKSSLSVENMMLACDFLEMTPSALFTKINNIKNELEIEGWNVNVSNVENDGLLIGRDLESSHLSKRLIEDKQAKISASGGFPFFINSGVALGCASIGAITGSAGASVAGGAVAAGGAAAVAGIASFFDDISETETTGTKVVGSAGRIADLKSMTMNIEPKSKEGGLIRKLAAIYIKSEKLFS
jgi:transcriptional regulator with XRE-family HTH domain